MRTQILNSYLFALNSIQVRCKSASKPLQIRSLYRRYSGHKTVSLMVLKVSNLYPTTLISPYPITTSRTIMRTKPMEKPIVLRLL